MFTFAEVTSEMTAAEILNYYRNLYYAEPQVTERGIVANAINDYLKDAAPRAEVDNLEYTLAGVMHSVDKWLDGDELEQDEVNRAVTMREKTLRIIETIKTDTAKAIFEELEKKACPINSIINRGEPVEWDMLPAVLIKKSDFEELKKEYVDDNSTALPDIDVNH